MKMGVSTEDSGLLHLQGRLLQLQYQLLRKQASRRSRKVAPHPSSMAGRTASRLAKLHREDLETLRHEQAEMTNFMHLVNAELDKQVQSRRDEALMLRLESRMQQTNLQTIKELITLMSTLNGRPADHPVAAKPCGFSSAPREKEPVKSRRVVYPAGSFPQAADAALPQSPSSPTAASQLSRDASAEVVPAGKEPAGEGETGFNSSGMNDYFAGGGVGETALFDESLLEMSEDDESVDEEMLASKKRIERSTKSLVYAGDSKPLYRWRKLGLSDIGPGQVLKGKALLRSIAHVRVFIARTQRLAEEKRKARFEKDQADMQELLEWFLDKSQAWLLKAVRQPLQSVISSPKLVLDPRPQALSRRKALARKLKGAQRKAKGVEVEAVMKLKVRLRAVLEALLNAVERNKPPVPTGLLPFLKRIVSDGSAFPNKFLFIEEFQALEFSKSRHTRWMVQEADRLDFSRGTLLLSNFIFKRCLIPIILKPWDYGLGRKPSKLAQHNLLVLASLLYSLSRNLHKGPAPGNPIIDNTKEATPAAPAEVKEEDPQGAKGKQKRAVKKVKAATKVAKVVADRPRRRSSISRRLSIGLASIRRPSQPMPIFPVAEKLYDDTASAEMAAQLLQEGHFEISALEDTLAYFRLLVERFVLALYKGTLSADSGSTSRYFEALVEQIKEVEEKMEEKGEAAKSQFDRK